MKTATVLKEVETGGLVDTGNFSIKATGKAFRILSDGLYSDKPLAVIRELSCNAFDAHVAAGKANIPFEVHLPNVMESYFSVKDFGVGLDHDGVMKLYTTYFESTKTDSNDFIGALGLGSKSPFSYVDQFTVTARFNGTKRTYSAFISPAGVPSIALLGEEPTSETNGLEVSMPVLTKDFSTFTERASKALCRFNPLPKITGAAIQIEPVEYAVTGTGWGMRNRDDNRYAYQNVNQCFAIQGSVAYKIDKDAMQGLTNEHTAILLLPIDITFAMGDLEVAASREGLSYDKRTIENIKVRLKQVYDELPSKYEDAFADCKTLWDARIKFGEIIKPLNWKLRDVISTKGISWRGTPVKGTNVDIDRRHTPDINFSYVDYDRSKRAKLTLIHEGEASFSLDSPIKVYWDDLSVRNINQRLKYEINSQLGGAHRLLVIRTEHAGLFNSAIKELGNPPFQKIANLPDPPKVSLPPGSRSVVKKVYRAVPSSLHRGHAWDEVNYDVTKGGIYVHLHKWSVVHPKFYAKDAWWLKRMLSHVEVLNYGFTLDDVCAIPGTHKKIPEKHKGWVLLYDKIKEHLEKDAKKQSWLDMLSVTTLWSEWERTSKVKFICDLDDMGLVPSIKDPAGDFGQLVVEVRRIRDLNRRAARQHDKITAWLNLNAEVLGKAIDVPAFSHRLEELTERLSAKYPLLHRFVSGHEDPELCRQWVDYINSCDER